MPWAVPQQAVEHSEQLCREFRGRWLLASDFVIGIWAPDESRLFGGSGITFGGRIRCRQRRDRHVDPSGLGRARFGYRRAARAAAMGVRGIALGTAVLALTAHLASQRVAEKAGLQREGLLRSHAFDPDGTWRDIVCYAILREEWAQRDSVPNRRAVT